jgi:replicative DNA helicase
MSAALERKLLSLLTTNAACVRVWEQGLRSVVFEEPINRAVFDWMLEYWRDNQMKLPPTWVVMEHEFPGMQFEDEVEESVDWLIDRLKDRYLINQAQSCMLSTAKDIDADPAGTVQRSWREMYDLVELTMPRHARSDMATNVSERRERYRARNDGQNLNGVTMGLREVDTHTRGLLPSELCAVAAYTKTGKSFLLANTFVAAHKAGLVPIMFTLEQRIPEMEDRIDALYSGVSYGHLESGTLTFEDSRVLQAAQNEMQDRGPAYVERPARGDRTVKNMVSRARQLGANYLLIDQLSFIDADREYTGDRALTAKHGDLIFELKDEISRESAGALPCMIAVQLNRETQRDRANGGRGGLANFANSSMIEQTVDFAFGLWRNDEMRSNHSMGLDIMGCRRGEKNNWLLRWELSERSAIDVREERDE